MLEVRRITRRELVDRLIEVHGATTLAQAARMTAEAAIAGTEQDVELCADLMNLLVERLADHKR